MKKLDCGLTVADAGQSADRVWRVVMGEKDPSNMPGRWLALAEAAGLLFSKYDGAPWAEIAKEVYEAFQEFPPARLPPAWADLGDLERIAWEAVTKHLAWLWHTDEPVSPEELFDSEAKWSPWSKVRMQQSLHKRSDS